MTRDEAVTLIGARLGYSDTTDVATIIQTELQLAQAVLERDPRLARPWFLLTEITDLTTTASEHKVSLPSDFLAEYEEGALWYYNTENENPWTELRKDKQDYLLRYYGADEAGAPAAYAIVGAYLWVFPLPDQAYTLKLQYYASDTVLTENVENDWLKYAPDMLISEAGLAVAQDLEHQRGLQFFAGMKQEARSRYNAEHEARQHDQMSYTMGT